MKNFFIDNVNITLNFESDINFIFFWINFIFIFIFINLMYLNYKVLSPCLFRKPQTTLVFLTDVLVILVCIS